ncbi:TPC1 [[Candida] subhashii]|uniref:TPC1 n=1 Tax=[Candida] subhashii TaxID=561895 RepID=A0A8J5Q8K5_9ASCO|nr:TPC1 [[Candida] subhashii]KAG7661461.1 TPC1 [[Candida] subhashii]
MNENKRERVDHLRKGSEVSPYDALLAGSISGAIARAVTAPLDTIKIRLQLQPRGFKERKSIAFLVKRLLRNEGIVALWKGNVPAEILYILYGGAQFTSYAVLNDLLDQYTNLNPGAHSLVVGSGAGCASTLLTYPFDLLRTRLVANRERVLQSMTKTIKSIYRKDGILGFFQGIKPALLSVTSNTGIMFWNYELAREYSTQYNNIPFIEGICGFIAGSSSKAITFPLDTLRRRSQVYSVVHNTKTAPAVHIFVKILKNEGIFGLYKGFGVSLVKTAPTSAVTIYFYEYALEYIQARNSNKMTALV